MQFSRYIFLLALFLLPASRADAQWNNNSPLWGTGGGSDSADAVNTSITSMELEKKHINLGTLVKGDQVKYEIRFTNTGQEDLIIETVKPSCNCSTPEWSFDPVKPGQKGTITVTYNTAEKTPGSHEGTITIVYNGIPNIEQVTFEAIVVAAADAPHDPPHNE